MPLRLEHRRYCLPFRRPVLTAHGSWTQREGLVVRLEDLDTGAVGWGEVAPIPHFGTETVEAARAALDELAAEPTLAALTALGPALPCTQFALAEARAGLAGPPPMPVRRLPVTALLPAGREVLEVATARADEGYVNFKWKVGVEPAAAELALLDRVLDRLPAGAQLRLDANGSWDEPTAERWLRACAGRPIEFVEQPFPPGRETAMFALERKFPVRFALDESIARLADLRRWLDFGWPGFFVVKPALCGPTGALRRALADFEVEAVFSSAFETAVGLRSALHLAFGANQDGRAVGFGTIGAFADDAFNPPLPGPFLTTDWVTRLDPAAVWARLGSN
jgi:O-succinylbenzoate synthase